MTNQSCGGTEKAREPMGVDLDEIRKALKVHETWYTEPREPEAKFGDGTRVFQIEEISGGGVVAYDVGEPEARFIVKAKEEWLTDLCDEVERLREELRVARLQKQPDPSQMDWIDHRLSEFYGGNR